ncbi:tRNA pseudouridine(55) synthase TruB [Aliidiomarina sanyensis]|uniref:tRNA pseudouridine synthase B n=1 Tax=Aliidiomarina sanyensis TaxID=1249555 RepID=A0A432WES6_9GAMM|nr:tRNA pseudouridine(55) synthase TruB [Aliidiomarina sanyensis]RUO31397.1 tRNA pseudouridine(55) synthase TruB [Aliidiomarina sanyensis]
MARKTRGRPIDGVILVDKPTGASSNRILQQVKRIFYAQKAGHTGALDPLATGMLPICLGEATKFAQFLLDADKAYRVVAEFGVRTNTSDADGTIVAQLPVTFTSEQLNQALAQFKGPIHQIPSMFSALKYQGKPLYEYARKGIEIERPARAITIYSIEVESVDLPYVTMHVRCSKGTYIRSLVDDLGQALGCGAHVKTLHRTEVGQYPTNQMHTLEALEAMVQGRETPETWDYSGLDALLLPTDSPVAELPEVFVDREQGQGLLHGQPLAEETDNLGGLIRVKSPEGFLGVAYLRADGRYWPKRVLTLS